MVDYSQIVPRKLVHKDGFDDIFLTSYAAVGPDEMVLGATLPRAHGFYCEFPVGNRRTPDLAVLIEICRQACFIVAHAQFDVSFDEKFIMKALSGEFVDTTPFDTDEPVNVEVTSKIERVWQRGGRPSGLLWAFTLRVGETIVATSRMEQTWISRATWKTMRAKLRTGRGLPAEMAAPVAPPPSQLSPADVGRLNPANVILEQVDEANRATLRPDLRHPVMFDHPADYIYAMVQLEGSRQLALLSAARHLGIPATDLELSAVSGVYAAVADFDLPTILDATVRPESGQARVDVSVTQNDRVVSSFVASVRPLALLGAQRPAA